MARSLLYGNILRGYGTQNYMDPGVGDQQNELIQGEEIANGSKRAPAIVVDGIGYSNPKIHIGIAHFIVNYKAFWFI